MCVSACGISVKIRDIVEETCAQLEKFSLVFPNAGCRTPSGIRKCHTKELWWLQDGGLGAKLWRIEGGVDICQCSKEIKKGFLNRVEFFHRKTGCSASVVQCAFWLYGVLFLVVSVISG